MTGQKTSLPTPCEAHGRGHRAATRDGLICEDEETPVAAPTNRVTGLNGYEATTDYHLWFRSYPQRPASRGGPTHSVHIARPGTEPGCYSLAELWQGPLNKLIKDAVTQGYLRKAAEVEQVGQLELFAGVG